MSHEISEKTSSWILSSVYKKFVKVNMQKLLLYAMTDFVKIDGCYFVNVTKNVIEGLSTQNPTVT